MELNQVIRERSSIRGYKSDKLSSKTIAKLIEAGLMAPTARNLQEIFITAVSTDSPVVADIQAALNPNAAMPFYYGAPTLFILSGDGSNKWSALDAGIAVQNMHLTAHNLGLGSVIIGCIDDVMHGEKSAELNDALRIPAGYSFKIALAVGYPGTVKAPHSIDTGKNAAVIG